MPKQLAFHEDARARLVRGVDKVADKPEPKAPPVPGGGMDDL